MERLTFPGDFFWGISTSSYQYEGAAKEDGKGESIIDRFVKIPGKIKDGSTGEIANDFYHRYKDDLDIMKEIGIKAHRFSISWPRVMPNGRWNINRQGLDFYSRLTDEMLERGIEPICTLYHWDLPQSLQDIGGWANHDIIEYFNEYAVLMYNTLGDRIKRWVTFIEPWVISMLGHWTGTYPPGITNMTVAIQVSHHLMAAHANAVETFRQISKNDGKIGISLNLTPIYPASEQAEDREAAVKADGFFNTWFLDPVLKGHYPEDMMRLYCKNFNVPIIKSGDMDLIKKGIVDFLGINYYVRGLVRGPEADSGLNGLGFMPVSVEGCERTEYGWEVFPQGLYDLLMRIDGDYNKPCMYVTENGCAYKDEIVLNSRIEDNDRIEFLERHLYQLHKAIEDGANVIGYNIWSLLDDFEWDEGYKMKFGLVHVDRTSLKRTFKKSALWYKDVISNKGFVKTAI